MPHFVLSDDLTGASGVASMVNCSLAATVNLAHFDQRIADDFPFVAINMEARESNEREVAALMKKALDITGDSWTTIRIDSALRGPIAQLLRQISPRGKVLLTDTVPEYGRFTREGKTYLGAQEKDLASVASLALGPGGSARVVIADSRSRPDLEALASRCVREGLIPVDPGPLISLVAKRTLLASSLPIPNLQARRVPVEKVAYVIGTRDGMTMKQLRYMSKVGYDVRQPATAEPKDVSIFSFSLASDASRVDDSFLASLRDYDALVLSGGATANFILERSGFGYIANGPQVQPLLSSGVVKGGLLDGKTVVLKGGFIGYENTYKTILEWLKQK
jgi:D-threonate/D-erythronate kinase